MADEEPQESMVSRLGALANIIASSPSTAASERLLGEPEIQRLLSAAAERVAEIDGALAAKEAPAKGVSATEEAGCTPGAGAADAWDVVLAGSDWEAVHAAGRAWLMVIGARGRTAAAAAALPPPRLLVRLALRLCRALALAPPQHIRQPATSGAGAATPLAAAVAAEDRARETFEVAMGLCSSAALAVEHRAGSAADVRALLPAALEAWAWGLRALAGRLRAVVSAAGGGLPRYCGNELASAVLGSAWFRLEDPSAGWSSLSGQERRDAAGQLAAAGLLRSLDSLLRLAGAAAAPAAASGAAATIAAAAAAYHSPYAGNMDPMLLGSAATGVLHALRPLLVPVAAAALGLPAAVPTPSQPAATPPPAASGRDVGRELGVLATAAKLLLRETAPLQTQLVHSSEWRPEGFTMYVLSTLEPLRGLLLEGGLGVGLGPEAGLPALLRAACAAADAAADNTVPAAGGGNSAGGGPSDAAAAAPAPGRGDASAVPVVEAVAELVALLLRAAVLACARVTVAGAYGLAGAALEGADDDDKLYRDASEAALGCAAAGLAALREAAPLLPPEAVLAAQPLTLLGGVGLAIVLCHGAVTPSGPGARLPGPPRPPHLVDKVRRGLVPLARSLVAAVALLGAEPALEPTVRRWLLPPAEVTGEPPGGATAGEWWYCWMPDDPSDPGRLHVLGLLNMLDRLDRACACAALAAMQNAVGLEAMRGGGGGGRRPYTAARPPPLLAVAREVLRRADLLAPNGERGPERGRGRAGSEREGEEREGEGERLRRRIAEAVPPGQRRLWPTRQLWLCSNPRCANLASESEEALGLQACGRCGAVRYCGAACQRADWSGRGGHKEACAALRAAGQG
ncbi:hypothetical protein GPECTOR_87g419 [Gonium pectorale]|uniref:phytol kinase n=1 Tax=Gonium pectorale TaxID=33097 RepID=A0A150G138_GONPE|nr:hypothetical protein GPECTOR_87g419 [Gonium pectorale]|eukprot:KXZ43557.1 hypothetical protein GPECTOR_87g419 [Gonium pectorale]